MTVTGICLESDSGLCMVYACNIQTLVSLPNYCKSKDDSETATTSHHLHASVQITYKLFPRMNGLTYLYAFCSNIDQYPPRTHLRAMRIHVHIDSNVAAMLRFRSRPPRTRSKSRWPDHIDPPAIQATAFCSQRNGVL
jgi:hypothetical protein